MPRLVVGLLVLMTILAAGEGELSAVSGNPQGPVRVAPDLVVKQVVFGYLDEKTGALVPTRDIDASRSRSFGWRVEFEGTRRSVRYREVFVLPSPAAEWGVSASTRVAPDRASAVTQEVVSLNSEMAIEHIWSHSPGDPKGRHFISVAVEGTPVADVHFTLR